MSDRTSASFVGPFAVVIVFILCGAVYLYLERARAVQRQQLMMVELEARKAAEDATQKAEASRAAAMEVVAAATESLSSPSMTEEEKKQAEAAIQKLLATQQNDWNNGDLDAFMQVYWQSDQLTFASGGKVTRGWQATLDGYKAKYPNREKQGKLTFDNLEFQSLSNSVMLVLGTWHLERGEESIGGNFSLIWNRIDGQWRIVHDHTSVLDKP